MASELMSPSKSAQCRIDSILDRFPAERGRVDSDQTLRNKDWLRLRRVQRNKSPGSTDALGRGQEARRHVFLTWLLTVRRSPAFLPGSSVALSARINATSPSPVAAPSKRQCTGRSSLGLCRSLISAGPKNEIAAPFSRRFDLPQKADTASGINFFYSVERCHDP